MGFGKKTDFESGRTLDLDKTYRNVIKPAVEAAGLQCVRADEIVHSGLIDVPMYEQLLEADVVVADLSTSNKNALYELGVRHALRPHTTVVIAEDGIKTFPFDVNHVLIRQYHHLGEDIGFDEVMRFRELLTNAIKTILAQTPPPNDSPIYEYLDGLTPPERAAAPGRARLQAMRTAAVAGTGAAPAPAAPDAGEATHSMLMQQVDELQAAKNFEGAKILLKLILENLTKHNAAAADTAYLVQRLALVTYKSRKPTEKDALLEAAALLQQLAPETSNDPETLGLWGAVHKRLCEIGNDLTLLDKAIRSYERGFYLRNDYYNGINYAFLLNVRAAHCASRAEAIADFVQARRVRQEVAEICRHWLEDNPPPTTSTDALKQHNESRYWVTATLAEAALGLGDSLNYEAWRSAAYALAVHDWMKESTAEQLTKLTALLAASPLKYIVEEPAGA
ncbi:MAG: DUF4071 domain-containing protein [Betaproteobacteria bacterium]|nr:MAG: DUF4071 domain-containing protein [Betaproteobacteria bacterium]